MKNRTPHAIVQAQLDAYNAKDIDALLKCYAQDAELYVLHGDLLAKGHAEIRPRFETRFAEPDLSAELLNRLVVGTIVIDHEMVTRNFAAGKGSVEMVCVYEIEDNHIRKASFFTKA
ncbi:nuclear transport factor 2 family protein [Thalassospira sp.]|uniref:nuclear transport factor 2 family protein n=1 Tax=Thalassospira sp. TaxID=1912094 RepID=UPI0027355D67|nr:nuclear transport factor 2 family protein [Thalassospira sp.]MDP2699482.1 nuclear transport factor 2 family protein [Thalassospira sp.]